MSVSGTSLAAEAAVCNALAGKVSNGRINTNGNGNVDYHSAFCEAR